MKTLLSKLNRSFQTFVFRHRLGRRKWSARLLFFFMDKLSRFETYSNTGEVNNFDHYVPQFLLKKFEIAQTGGLKNRIYQLDYQTALIGDKSIKQVAGEVGYDAFKDKTGAMSDYISKKLYAETLEFRNSFIIKSLLETDGDPSLTFLEESTFAAFLAFQLTRVPAFHSAVERLILYLYDKGLLKIADLGNHEFLESVLVKNSLGITLEQLQNYQPHHSFKGARNHVSLVARLIASAIAEKIYRGYLHIIDVPSGSNDRYVVSDNPIVLLDFERHEVLKYPAWWEINKERLWIFMPISPTRCILYSKSKKKDGRVENNNIDLVQLVNFGQYLNATKYIFSNDKNVIASHLQMYAKELSQLRLH